MDKLLVIFKGNWADEMDIEGFMFISKAAWEYKKLEWEHTPFPVELYVGTNEAMEYEKLGDYLRDFEVKEITDGEEESLKSLFSIKSKYGDFGHVPWLEGNASDSFYDEYGHCPD